MLDAVPVKDPHRGSLKFLFVSPGKESSFNYSFSLLLFSSRGLSHIFVLCRNLLFIFHYSDFIFLSAFHHLNCGSGGWTALGMRMNELRAVYLIGRGDLAALSD